MIIRRFRQSLFTIGLAIIMLVSVTSIVYAEEIERKLPIQQTEGVTITEVITPEAIVEKQVRVLPTYNSSNLGTFNNLNDLTTAVMKANKSIETDISFTYKGRLTDLQNLSDAISEALYLPGNDYVHGTLKFWSYQYDYTGNVSMEFEYLGTAKQEKYVTEKVKEIASSLTKPGMTDFEKVRVVNEYVVSHTIYSTDTITSPHHVYTYLTEGKAVCQAYALLTYRLLTEMGVETRYVVGDAGIRDKFEPHAWNSVKIDGIWYHLDTTWNDSSFNGSDMVSNIGYNYFLVTSEMLRKDHRWLEKKFPVANDNRYNYFQNVVYGIEHYGEIYYTDKATGYLSKLNLETGKHKELLQQRAYYLSAHHQFIYFSNYSRGGYLTAYNILTGETTIIDQSNVKELKNDGTYLYYKVGSVTKSYKLPIAVATSPITASNITIVNNASTDKDSITFKNLLEGAEYTIKDSSKKKLASFVAKDSTVSIKFKHLNPVGGSIFITVKKPYHSESKETKVTYKAEKLPALAAKNIVVTNAITNDTIRFSGLTKNNVYTVYTDAALKKVLTTFTATGTTKSVSVKQVGAKAGTMYVVVSKKGYFSSTSTKVSFKAEPVGALAAKNVTITNNIGRDKISFKGLTIGNTYTIYTDSKLKNKLSTFKATTTTKSLSFKQIGAKAGTLYFVTTKSGYLPSATTKVAYKAQPTTALASKNVKVTNAKVKDTIKFTGLKKDTTYVIYQDAKKKTKLASFKATGSTKTVTLKQLGTKAGKIYITALAPGYSVSPLTTVSYSKQK